MIKAVYWFGFAVVLGGITLQGCTTTGDPTRGGLLGWSRAMGDARAAQYEQEAQTASQAAEAERSKSVQLSQTLTNEKTERTRAQVRLNALLRENDNLREKLKSLQVSQKKGSKELDALEKERETLLQMVAGHGDIVVGNDFPVIVDQIGVLNERYKEAIMMLLQ